MSRRRGIVLGAGGFLGAAWTVGALAAIQETTGWDARGADVIVGTSAGSVLAALLRLGVSVDSLYDAHCGAVVTAELSALPERPPGFRVDLTQEPSHPGLPKLGVGSLQLVMRFARNPLRLSPGAVCAALLPRGRRPLTRIGQLVRDAGACSPWPDGTWIVAMNYHTGAREAFGRAGSPTPPIAEAVMASCAVPAWYAPIRIGQVPYIDRGVCSPYNADLLAGSGVDEVYVLAPMASLELDRPRDPIMWVERMWRRGVTRRLHREVRALRAAGIKVTVLAPNADDLAVIGANMMDATRQGDVMRTAKRGVEQRLTSPPRMAGQLDEVAA